MRRPSIRIRAVGEAGEVRPGGTRDGARARVRVRVRAALVPLAALAGLFAFGAVAACSLGLDESLLDREDAGGVEAGPLPDVVTADARDAAAPPPPAPEAGPCTKNADCETSDPCLTPRCDVPRGACAFDVCRNPACTAGVCDTTAASHVCKAGEPYTFAASSFPVGAGVNGAPAGALAAVYPYVLVSTTEGVVAFSAADPTDTSPRPVTVAGIGFVPRQIVASGSRVFFLGSNSGTPNATRVELAVLDVPADPFATTLTARSVLPTLNRPAGSPLVLLPRANDTALLVDNAASPSSFPTAKVEPPFTEPVTLTAGPIPFTAGSRPVATSGTRLVMHQVTGPTQTAVFSFVADAGGAPTTSGDVPAPLAGPVNGAEAFANSPEGALLWVYQEYTPPMGPVAGSYKGVKASFLVGDAAAGFDVSAAVAVEVAQYAAAPVASALVGGAALVDAKTAIVTSAAPANIPALSDVQLVTKQPAALVAGKKAQIPLGVANLAAASSNGLAYVLASESPTAATVYVYDPGCAP
jgi:hypothetical protein